ncbi:putative tail protein [Vibrio phage pVco-14]|nr:putative tail protein [Vibrio phage pVco-14]
MNLVITEHKDHFNPNEHNTYEFVTCATSIRGVLKERFEGFVEFNSPTIVLVNGDAKLRKEWDDHILKDGDHISIAAVPGTGIEVVVMAIIAVAAAAYAVYAVNNLPDTSAVEKPKSKPVYSLEGESNIAKLGQPIEVVYGKNRWWPSYASRPFTRFQDDNQFLYQLFCLGQGEFADIEIQIEDTPINSFQEVQYEIYPPGTAASMFPDSVVTSNETAGLELFGPNEGQFQVYGPFVVNPPGTKTDRIEVDVVMPQGMYYMKDDGGLEYRSASILFEVQVIDDAGNPQGSWFPLASARYNYRTTDVIRRTIAKSVGLARYQIRGRRTNNADTSYRAGNKITWEGTRAILPSTKLYGNVTLLAVAIRATNNLNDASSNRINVIATRKLPILKRGKWVPTKSRSLVWAAIDVLCNAYGAQVPVQYLDMQKLELLDQEFEAKGIFFDYIFTQKTKIWDALKLIFKVGRAEPIVLLPLISAFKYEKKSIPNAVFTPDNIIEGSFEWLINYPDPLEPDGLEVTYIDQTTWKEDVVECIPPGSQGVRTKKVELLGCADRNNAYHEGMYMALRQERVRETVKFRTGREGFIPIRGDMIAVSYPIARWGSTGSIVEIADDKQTLYLDRAVPWSHLSNVIMLRLDNGSGFGPVEVTKGANETVAILKSPLPNIHFSQKVGREPVYFLFGENDKFAKLLQVEKTEASSNDEVTVTATNYEDDLDQFDSATAPPSKSGVYIPKVPDLPDIPYANIATIPGDFARVNVFWGTALGAKSYVLQASYDNGVTWRPVVTTNATSYNMILEGSGLLKIRVQAINVGAGPWKYASAEVGQAANPPLDVTGLSLSFPFVGKTISLQWNRAIDAQDYVIEVYDFETDGLLTTLYSPGVSLMVTYADALSGGYVRRKYKFRVYGRNSKGWSKNAAVIDVANPIPEKVTGISSTQIAETSTTATFRVKWTGLSQDDIRAYRVWGSKTNNFTPDDSTLVLEANATSGDITIQKSGGTIPILYGRIAALDVWGDEYNVSDQFIAAQP